MLTTKLSHKRFTFYRSIQKWQPNLPYPRFRPVLRLLNKRLRNNR